MENEITIRTASVNDAEALIDIYAPYIKNTAVTFEYDVPTVDEFRSRIEKTLTKYPYLVAEYRGKIIGYAYAGTFIGRAACDWSVETSIYVSKDFRGNGVGKALYNKLELILAAQNIVNLNACIACSDKDDEYINQNSMLFHARMGYTFVGRFNKCGYKFGRWYCLMWMEKIIGEHTMPKPFIPFSKLH